MALDVWIGWYPEPQAELRLSFDPEVYYWVLHPLFERLRSSHGIYIDLYGTAVFAPPQLPRLGQLLDEAEADARSKPPTWKEHVGTLRKPRREELYAPVERERFLAFLREMRAIIQECAERSMPLVFLGD